MKPGFKKFVQSWIINTLAVALTTVILHDHIRYDGWKNLLLASLLLGILNAFIRPIMLLMALPLLIFTLGLFTIVINACLLYLVHALMGSGFEVDSFGWAMLGALIISIVSLALNVLTGTGNTRVTFSRRPGPPKSGGGGDGPVIDV